MPTFDGINLIVTLDAPTDGVLTQDVEVDLYNAWKTWMLESPTNRKYPPVFFDSFGGDDLTPGITAGAYFKFQNNLGWRIRSSEADQTVYVVGNLTPADSSLPITIPTIGAYTVLFDGLQPITQNIDSIKTTLEFAAFADGVTIDTVLGEAGTGYNTDGLPIGIRQSPSNNIADAHTILMANGLPSFYIASNLTISAEDLSHGHKFIADSPASILITVDPSADVTDCEFLHASIQGTLDGTNILRQCITLDLSVAAGNGDFLQECALSGTITLVSGTQVTIWNCKSNIAGGGPAQYPYIDMGGAAGVDLIVRDYSGGLGIKNCSAAIDCSMDFESGRVVFDADVTNGTFYVRGSCEVTDNSTGSAVVYDLTDTKKLTDMPTSVWNQTVEGTYTAEQVMRIMSSALAGKTSKAGGVRTLRDVNDTKDRVVASVTDTGDRTAVVLDAT